MNKRSRREIIDRLRDVGEKLQNNNFAVVPWTTKNKKPMMSWDALIEQGELYDEAQYLMEELRSINLN